MVKSEKLWQDYLLVNVRECVVRDNAGCFKCILVLLIRTCAKMGANRVWAYVGHGGIIFQSPYFQDVCIWDTPICQFSGHADAKTMGPIMP